ncbi:hypothetical protein Tco_0397175 [Tanacetum coccineum]
MWSQVIVSYDKFALWGISHWGKKRRQFYAFATTRESARNVYSKRRIINVTKVEIVEWQNYKYLDWITVRRDDDILYKFKEGDLHRLRIQDIEDMLLLLVQGKLTNLNVEERLAFNVSLRMFTRSVVIQRRVEYLQLGVKSYQKKLNLTKPDTYRSNLRRRYAYTPYSDPRGFIYENKDKKNRLMRIDELHKFSDGTLDDIRTALNDRLKGIRMEYLPQTFWSQRDQANARAMVQAIDKRLKTRRIMRSLERFVGGRPYGGCYKTSYDSLRLSQAQFLWGMYNNKKVDYAYLLWEDFIYQIKNKNTKKGNVMYYPRFTKLVVNFVMAKDPSIPRRNKLYGTILPAELKNEDIRNSESYREYYAIASGKIPPKTKASKKKADTDATTKQKPPIVPKEKKGKKTGKGKQQAKELETIFKAVLTEAEQLKIITKRSHKETHN